MCFPVDRNATRPTDKVVYKVVRKTKKWGRGYAHEAPIYSSPAYVAGKVIKAEGEDPNELEITTPNGGSSCEGIYVFDTQEHAKVFARWLTQSDKIAIATLRVDPRDWLVSATRQVGKKNGARTYRKVKVIKVEPL